MKTLALALIVSLSSLVSRSQNETPVNPTDGGLSHPFLGENCTVPAGYTLSFGAGYPVFGNSSLPLFARAGLGVGGVLELTYSNEGFVGNMLGVTRPVDAWDARIQLSQASGVMPAMTLWALGTIGWTREDFGAYDLWGKYPTYFNFGVDGARYEYSGTSLGLSFERRFEDALSLSVSGGVENLRSRNLWIFIAPAPIIGNGFHETNGHSSMIFDGAVNISYVVVPGFMSLVAAVSTLPYFVVNPLALSLDLKHGMLGTIGVRYQLAIPVNVEGFVRWQSNINGQYDTQFRLGVSGTLGLQ